MAHRAKTGDERKTRQPLKLDKLPPSVHAAIQYLRGAPEWLSYEAIEERSALPYCEKWMTDGGGFVDWDKLPMPVLELFPDMRIGHSLLHRWWDLRVAQVSANVEKLATQAREISQVFAKAALKGDKETVQSAARDILLGILAEDSSADGKAAIAGKLVQLGKLMQLGELNKLRERKVAVDERKMAQLEKDAEVRRNKLEAETQTAAKKASKGEIGLADINRIRQRVMGLPPIDEHGNVVVAP